MSPWRERYDYYNLPVGNTQRSRVEYQQQRRYGDDPRLQMVEEEARYFSPRSYGVGSEYLGMYGERSPPQRRRIEVGPGKSGLFGTDLDFQHSGLSQPNRDQNSQYIAPGHEYRSTPRNYGVGTDYLGMYGERSPPQRQRIEVGRGKSGVFGADLDFQHSGLSQPNRGQDPQYIAPGQEVRFSPRSYGVGSDYLGMYGERSPPQRRRIEVGPSESGVFGTDLDFQHSGLRQPNRGQHPQYIAHGQEYRSPPRRYEFEADIYDGRRPPHRQRCEVGPGKSGVFRADLQQNLFTQPNRAENVLSVQPGQENRVIFREKDKSNETCPSPFQFSEYGQKDRRAEQERVRLQLEQQEREEKERRRKKREEQIRYERQMEEEMMNYNPFGREGCGAPRRDARGNPLADLRQMRIENEGYAPRYNSPREYTTDIEKTMKENYRKDMDEYNEEARQRKKLQREKERMEELKEDQRIERERLKMNEEYDAEMRKKREKVVAKMAMEERLRNEAEKEMQDARKRKRLQREKKRLDDEMDNLRVERERKQMKEEYEEEKRRKKEKDEIKKITKDTYRDEAKKAMEEARERKRLQVEKERLEEEKDNLRVERERKQMSRFGSTSPPVPAVLRKMQMSDWA